ncbi:MAG: type IV secretory system conjugative DNA transfer family protein, partial [Lachnospiraceae bacterium]|nr:type IV secretory system conjugative DNA transfer family protein [Lachnospiraceae bacterium]
ICIGLAAAGIFKALMVIKAKDAKKFRHGEEYGSARWGTHADIEPFMDPVFKENVILTQTERLMMGSRPKNPKYARNKNVLIIGGSGSGKTRFWLKPNLLQMHSSYVITDPKGEILQSCGNALLKKGRYRIKILNTINFKKSMHYNPFAYIHSEKDILKLVTTLIANTKGEGKAGDEFWTKAESLLYMALIGYIHYEAPVEEQNFTTLLEMLNAMEVREDDEDFKNPVDLMFDELKEKNPNHFAVREYAKFKLSAGKTSKSILVSCGARLAPFDIQEVRDITSYDELGLDTLGDQKTALFLIMSDTDSTFNFLISMAYSQMFNLLCEKADDVYGGRLPVHVRCLIDEAANIGQIPNLEKLVATIRSREISACLILQARSQLKAIYKDNCDTIIGNMDSQIFLGGTEPTTLKELSQALGKETIDLYTTGNSKGSQESFNTNYQKTGKELRSIDELAVMDGGQCILQLRGVRPFLSDKYDITQHPNYRYTSDFDKRNTFDIEKFLHRKMKLHPEDEFVVIDADEVTAK